MIPHLLLLIHHLSLPAQAARIPPPSSNPTSLSLFNLTSGNDPNISPGNPTAIRVDVPYLYCTPTRRWNQPAMEQEDCRGVLGYLYHETMTDGGRGSMEFMSPGARKTRKIKGQMTPRKYTFGKVRREICHTPSHLRVNPPPPTPPIITSSDYILVQYTEVRVRIGLISGKPKPGTCTVAIVMIDDFPEPTLLPGGYRTGPPTDATTYFNLNRVAADLVNGCVLEDGEAGWQPTGQKDGIGVFIWSTGSQEDREIEDEKVRSVFRTRGTFGNGSAAAS